MLSRKSNQRNYKNKLSFKFLRKLRLVAFGAMLVSSPFIFGVDKSYAATAAAPPAKIVSDKENSDLTARNKMINDKMAKEKLAVSAKEGKQIRKINPADKAAIEKKQKAITDRKKAMDSRQKAELEKKNSIKVRPKAVIEKRQELEKKQKAIAEQKKSKVRSKGN
jgi:hypothetical protein